MADEQSKMMGKFRANGDSHQTNTNKINKRNRPLLSCLPCRQRKLKCDRAHPCETCLKRNDESSCIYSKATNAGKPDLSSRAKAQERLRQLEQLVMQMVDSNAPVPRDSSEPLASAVNSALADDGTPRDGRLEHGISGSKYVGSTHWSAVFENIQELKSAMTEEGSKSPELEEVDDIDTADQEILFGSKRSISLQQILALYLPERIQIDRLLSTYFNAKYMVMPYIHTFHFQTQYEEFWADPLQADALWLSVLFSICCIGAQLTAAAASMPTTADEARSQSKMFLTASAQCLILGGYTRPRKHVVEALALHAQCKYNTSLDPSAEVGIIFAILIRLAYRMAYHRDADNFSHFSVFEAEMRRRVWTMCKQFDLMISFQLGLPNSIPIDSWDTKSPRNLLDADFDGNTTTLPPSRPETEPTQILYFIVKSRLMTNFGKICNHALSFKNSSQTEIMALDDEVRQTFATVPDTLQTRPMSQSFADPPYLLMVRLNCRFLYEKSLLVLHRKYMTQGFEFSTNACIEAAIAIASCFIDIHQEFQPGGQLYHDRWMLSSFTMNDFLLAAMILCLALSQWRKRNPDQIISSDRKASEQLTMLRTCYDICQERAPTSTESRRVAGALKAMLAQFPRPTTTPATVENNSYSTGFTPQPDVMNLAPLSLDEAPPPPTNGDRGPFEYIFEGGENIDWQFLDQYLVNPERFDESGDVQVDWQSTPVRFLGQTTNNASSYYFDASTQDVSELNDMHGPAQNGTTGAHGQENGHLPSY